MPIEEEWTGFDYGAMRTPIMNAEGKPVPGRAVAIVDPDSKRTIVLKFSEQEVRQFAELIVNPPERPVVARGDDGALRRGGPLPGVPGGPSMPQTPGTARRRR